VRQNTQYSNAFVNRHFSVDIRGTASALSRPVWSGVSLGMYSAHSIFSTIFSTVFRVFASVGGTISLPSPERESIIACNLAVAAHLGWRRAMHALAEKGGGGAWFSWLGTKGNNSSALGSGVAKLHMTASDFGCTFQVHQCLGRLLSGLFVFPVCGSEMKSTTRR
jgi:hypothetical protein